MSRRTEQLSSTLLRAVQSVVSRGLSDPRTDGALITITGLTVSPDLRNATVLVSVLPEKRQELCVHALVHAAGHIRRRAGELVAMATLPALTFKLDLSLKKEARVIRALGLVAPDSGPSDAASIAPSDPAAIPSPAPRHPLDHPQHPGDGEEFAP